MYLCDMASVSQLCIFSPLFIYMGCCEDYLTCNIAFNAVMPLSHALTRGRYSRIEGVTAPTFVLNVELSVMTLGHPAHSVSLEPFEVALQELKSTVRWPHSGHQLSWS